MTADAFRHLYVHVPFCSGKCAYCAFYSERYTPERAALWLAALEREWAQATAGRMPPPAETVYVGGGTPSVLAAGELARLFAILRSRTRWARGAEVTVEANPGTLDPPRRAALRAAGVTRVSLGAQAFGGAALRAMGRRHDAGAIGATVAALRSDGWENIGLDLIAGWPGVTAAAWRRTLRAALDLRPAHVSVYALSVEDGTALAARVRAGAARPPGEAALLGRLAEAARQLGAAGYRRYEVSNYALPQRECRHNSACWEGRDYLGLGPAASSRSGRQRWTNAPDLDAWAAALVASRLPPREAETVDPRTDALERLVFAFRLADGVPASRLAALPTPLRAAAGAALARLAGEGAVIRQAGRWRLADSALTLADHAARELLGC